MGEEQHELTDVVHRGRDDAWLQQAQQNRRRRRRRSLGLIAAVTVAVLTAGFFINDGPRRSGMLDAAGLTCGEFVVAAAAADEQIFEPWDEHAATLEAAAELHTDDDAEFDWQAFTAEVEAAAAQLEAEPLHAVFTGWTPGEREASAAAVGGQLLIGHHEEMWTITEAVSVADPETGQAQWRADLEHPQWEDWQNPERVLYGVGALAGQLVLQTPAANGDTDVVTFDAEDEWNQDCIRLAGNVDPVEVLKEQPRAWPVVMNLNLGRISHSAFLALHGLDSEQGSGHLLSEVEATTGEAEPAGDYDQAYPPDSEHFAAERESLHVAEDFDELVIEELKPVGEAHYLLTWDAGSVILQRS